MGRAARTISLGVVLACVLGTMALGTIQKGPCANGAWKGGKQYRLLCYTDVVPLVGTEQLAGGRLPFLDRCREVADQHCDEYPVLTMYFMRAAAWVAGTGYASFFFANAFLLALCAAVIGVCLWRLAGRRALWFALAPTLLIYGTMNWDLFAVALATAALLAFADRRDVLAGALLGLGAAAKFYPALLVLPLFLQRLQGREPDRAVTVLWAAAGTWALVDIPFALASPGAWWEFFRFNGSRVPDFDSLWYIACRYRGGGCLSTTAVNAWSAALFAASFAVLWAIKVARSPRFPRWTLGFPLLVTFLLANKVYSPQYGLWLLPWFALALPDLKRFVAFEIADLAVFVTRFWFFGSYTGEWGTPQWWFEVAVLVRTAVLVWCLIGWLLRETEPLALGRTPAPPAPTREVAVA
jgi:uncharacterized membrane protein